MAAGYPSGSNTFVPSHEASGSLIAGFSRNPKKFALNRYCKTIPVKESIGYYLQITAEQAARMTATDMAKFRWADGQEAPLGDDNLESHLFAKFSTNRYSFPFTLGQKSIDQASWDILAVHGGFAAQQAMTARTISVGTILETAGSWAGATGTAASIAGGYLDTSTETTLYIYEAVSNIKNLIHQATLGVVQETDLVMVMNPNTARRMAKSQEIIELIKQSPFILAQIRGDKESQNGKWGLPDMLYGIRVEIEDAVKVTSKKGATKATSYVFGDGKIAFLSRPGGLVGMEGIPEFSTICVFAYEEMTVETRPDLDNRRTMGRVVDDYGVEMVAPASGYLLTSVLSS